MRIIKRAIFLLLHVAAAFFVLAAVATQIEVSSLHREIEKELRGRNAFSDEEMERLEIYNAEVVSLKWTSLEKRLQD